MNYLVDRELSDVPKPADLRRFDGPSRNGRGARHFLRSWPTAVIAALLGMTFAGSNPASGAPASNRKPAIEKKEISSQTKPEAKREPKDQGEQKNAGPPRPPQREPFDAAAQNAAVIAGMPDARFWADSEKDFLSALPSTAGPWLVLSGGGADGAFGAGVLNGLTQSGQRPEFAVVTGVSTGGLLATHAFLGSRDDHKLREEYTNVTAADVFEIGGTGESLFDTWPLKRLIAKRVTPEFLAEVASEHRRGRRLFVVTTNLDAERSVVWNMGAIAAHGSEAALKLFRTVLLASASLPGLFPPVVIETSANGKTLQELHSEGGLGGPFFVAPRVLLSSAKSALLPVTGLYIVINSKLAADFYMTERNTAAVLARSIAAALKTVMRAEIEHIYAVAKREGVDFNLAYVEDDFSKQARGPFDSEYMRALFDRAVELGKSGAAFRKEPPGS